MWYTKCFCLLLLVNTVVSCGNGQTDAELKDPADVHPPSEAIPDSTTIVNDSVIVPEVTPDTGMHRRSNDSAQRRP